jgi:hypothetical protein
MTIRYSAARPVHAPVTVSRAGLVRISRAPANDNGDVPQRDLVLRNALLHFAEHGLRAAEDAAERAQAAARLGDLTGRNHWLDICQALDARRARGLSKRIGR